MNTNSSLTDKDVLRLAFALNFRAFFERVFLEVEPRVKLVDGKFIDVMLDHLEQVLNGSSRRLIINLPPRHLKSLLVSVAFVAFVLGQDPRKRLAVISHSQALARDLAGKTKRVMESGWYREVFPRTSLVRDSLTELKTSEGGCRYAASFDTGVTGRGFDIIIVDDPISAHNVMSEVERSKNVDVFNRMIASRLDYPELGAMIVVAQRLHDDDLPGVLVRQGGWTHLSLPLVADEEMTYRIGAGTWVRKPGEVLVPELYSADVIAEIRRRLGEANFAAQYQQNPGAASGEVIKDEHIRRFELAQLPPGARRFTLSIDTALKQGEDASYTVALVIATDDRFHYVVDVLRGKFDFVQMRDAVLRMIERYRIKKSLVEDSAAGPSLASVLRERGHQAELWPTRGNNKLERLQEHLHLFVEGRIFVAGDQPWTTELVNELLCFPNGRHDDQVDALSQYLAWIAKAGAHTPVVLGANRSEARMMRAMMGPRPARGVHPMRNPKLGFRTRLAP